MNEEYSNQEGEAKTVATATMEDYLNLFPEDMDVEIGFMRLKEYPNMVALKFNLDGALLSANYRRDDPFDEFFKEGFYKAIKHLMGLDLRPINLQ